MNNLSKGMILVAVILGITVIIAIVLLFIISKQKKDKGNTEEMKLDEMTSPIEEKTINLSEIAEEINSRTEILEDKMPPTVTLTLMKVNDEKKYECELADQIVIGKEGTCNDILIEDDKAIAGRQCRIFIDRTGYKLEDLGSANGTYLNNDCILGVADIRNDDVLLIGRSAFTVKMEVI